MKKRFNIIDVLIIILVLIAVAGVGIMRYAGKTSDADEAKKQVTLEITEKFVGFSENVVIGDKVTEKVDNKQIGTVTGVRTIPAEKNSYDRETGEAVVTLIPERETVYVTIETDKDEEVAVGKLLSVVTKHFSGSGYVTEVADIK